LRPIALKSILSWLELFGMFDANQMLLIVHAQASKRTAALPKQLGPAPLRSQTPKLASAFKREGIRMSEDQSVKVSRRTILFAAAAVAPVLALGRAEAAPTFSQDSVNYQQTPKDGNHCSVCKQFVAPSSCKSVKGAINPNGYCKLFNKKDA
jgi:hypothetical protein